MSKERMIMDYGFYKDALKDVRGAIHHLVELQYHLELDGIVSTLREKETELLDKLNKITINMIKEDC